VDGHAPETWERSLKSNTRAIYFEALTNPLVQLGDLEAVVAFAKKHDLVSIIDATFASPCGIKPIELGFDLVVQSCTKYMNGHSDIVAGSVTGSKEWIKRINAKLIHFGACLDPHACFILDRGLKTLPARMRLHNENALALAKYLEKHPMVARVHYPGLESHSDYARAKRLLRGGAGGVLSFELKAGVIESEAMLRRLKIPVFAPSLGGVETLVTIPSLSTHRAIAKEERLRMGIQDNLIRVAVGIEASADLIQDFAQALK
jgi:cystathionine beta-lyase/cystathionine gamma-synthase